MWSAPRPSIATSTDAGARIVNGTPRATAAEVVVFAAHDELHFTEMRGAMQAVLGGAELIATDRDGSYPSADGMAPGTGAFLAALEYATGATGRVVGKPEPQLFYTALDRIGPGRALVDRRPAGLRPGRRRGGRARRRDRAQRRHLAPGGGGSLRPGARGHRRGPSRPPARLMTAVSVIVNPSAAGGRARRALPAVQARLSPLGLEHRVTLTRDLDHARELARAAAAAGEIAAAFGGDGVIGAVAGALKGSDGVLGILPGGRGNDFARTLGVPRDPEAACDVLAHGEITELDLGRVGDSHVHRHRQLRL